MAMLIVHLTARTESSHAIAEAWQQAGAPGVTLIEGYGLRRLTQASRQFEVLPGLASLFNLARENDQTSIMILSLIQDDGLLKSIVAATESVVGALKEENNGILFTIPVGQIYGL